MVLKNKVIVILSNIRIDGPIQASSLFLARELAKYNQVFFVDYPLTFKDYFNKENAGQVAYRKGKFSRSSDGIIDTDLPGLKYVITPPVVPVNFLPEGFVFDVLRKINENIIAKRINKVLRSVNRKNLIYINSFNFHFPGIAKKIKPALNIYHCVDPMIVDYDKKHGPKAEAKLINEADVVVCTSEELYREKKPFNTNTYLVPNGANASYYSDVLNADFPVHPKLKDIKRPIVGYLGTIERRIDYPLIEEVVKANPDKSFVFAGPVWSQEQIVSLQTQPNVHFLGAIAYEETPQIIKGYDVTIIPFQVDKVSSTIFPLKLFEYLSAGKPVVITNFNPDLKAYTKDAVAFCDNATSFTKAIDEALTTNSDEKVAYRVSIAQENTWEKRGLQIAEILQKHLN